MAADTYSDINALDSLGSTDGATDLIVVGDASATTSKKSTRNTYLGISSAPLGTTDIQSPTNKTFDNTNVFTIRDDRLTLQDNSDTTKQANFQLSGISTATTRTFTLPDANTTLVGTDATQTLTNKTLTSPTINSPTISNPTITVDSIAEYTSANGVSIDGVLHKDGVIGDGHVVPNSLVAGAGTSWTPQTWSVAYTNVTVGDGTVVSRYTQTGKRVTAEWLFTFGSTSSFAASHTISLPVTAASGYSTNLDIIGSGIAYDASAPASVPIYAAIVGTTNFRLRGIDLNAVFYDLSSTVPYTWATGDKLLISFSYWAA